MEVILRLTEKQATVITTALDLYSRVLIGQVENVEEVLRWTYPKLSTEKLQTARLLLNSVKDVLWGFSPGASHGIHNPEVQDNARQAFDLLQVVRNGVARAKKPEGGIQVCYDVPSQTSTKEPLATIEVKL
jgi:hypothetical protein